MKKTKVENISNIKLEFFLIQDKKDIRVSLNPGESSWFDENSTTKSMILYERKGLIKIKTEEDLSHTSENINIVDSDIITRLMSTPNAFLNITEIPEMTLEHALSIFNKTEDVETELSPFEQAEKEVEEYKKTPTKTYTGKKRGRKKKRGPKPGAKKAAAKAAKKNKATGDTE